MSSDKVFNGNVGGPNTMLEAATECGVEAFVYTTSCTVITYDVNLDYYNM